MDRQSSAELGAESGCSITQIAKELGINTVTLYGWINKYYPKQQKSTVNQQSLEEELKMLRKENLRLKQEHDILKKAAAYFVNETSLSTRG